MTQLIKHLKLMPKQSPKKSTSLRILGIIELILALLAIAIYFKTRNADDFSGLAILFPIFGMAVTGIIAFVLFIIQSSQILSSGKQNFAKKISTLTVYVIFSVPVLYLLGGFWGRKYTIVLLIFLCLLAVYVFVDNKLGSWSKLYKILLLAFAPLLAIMYYGDPNDTAPHTWLILSLVIFIPGLIEVILTR